MSDLINPPNLYTPLISSNFIPLFGSNEESSEEDENSFSFTSFNPILSNSSNLFRIKKYSRNKNIIKFKFVEKCRKIKKIQI